MAEIKLTVPDAQLDRVRNAFCAVNGYQDTIDGQPNPVSKNQFLKQQLMAFVKSTVKSYEESQAAKTIQEVEVT